MIVKYKHEIGTCESTFDFHVDHRKVIYLICPTCKTMSGFIPTENYDKGDDFAINYFRAVDPSLFTSMKKQKKKRKPKTTATKQITKSGSIGKSLNINLTKYK